MQLNAGARDIRADISLAALTLERNAQPKNSLHTLLQHGDKVPVIALAEYGFTLKEIAPFLRKPRGSFAWMTQRTAG
jgi:hypothetical protein